MCKTFLSCSVVYNISYQEKNNAWEIQNKTKKMDRTAVILWKVNITLLLLEGKLDKKNQQKYKGFKS